MWGKGDGALVTKYPEFTYRQAAPTSAELLVMCIVATVCCCTASLIFNGATKRVLDLTLHGTRASLLLFVVNILHDLYRHGWRNADRTEALQLSVTGWQLALAMTESTFIRMFIELGRLVGMLERREFRVIGRSFDWFTNRVGDGPRREENRDRLERIALWVLLVAMWYA